jgi:hypothetical protein
VVLLAVEAVAEDLEAIAEVVTTVITTVVREVITVAVAEVLVHLTEPLIHQVMVLQVLFVYFIQEMFVNGLQPVQEHK